MTFLQVMAENKPTDVLLRTAAHDEIAGTLRGCSVRLRRWPVRGAIEPTTSEAEILSRYADEIDGLRRTEGLRLVDVVRFHPEDDPRWLQQANVARKAFREEHRHGEDEIRFFAQGQGCFYLHRDHRVFALICEAGDLLSVPAGTTHWFDMGARPDFCAIRFFEKEDGWIGDFTGDPIAQRFPSMDALMTTGAHTGFQPGG